eukprot:8295784-Pyramimonas_sp.AAC.1
MQLVLLDLSPTFKYVTLQLRGRPTLNPETRRPILTLHVLMEHRVLIDFIPLCASACKDCSSTYSRWRYPSWRPRAAELTAGCPQASGEIT